MCEAHFFRLIRRRSNPMLDHPHDAGGVMNNNIARKREKRGPPL
jgi:hypothetical protein